jgi:hypothetical protein
MQSANCLRAVPADPMLTQCHPSRGDVMVGANKRRSPWVAAETLLAMSRATAFVYRRALAGVCGEVGEHRAVTSAGAWADISAECMHEDCLGQVGIGAYPRGVL